MDREGLFGHSLGGHGARVCALRQPGRYRSVSAFAPICAPMRCPWGQKAFQAQDATELLQEACEHSGQPLTLRRQDGYDHGYDFVSTFLEDPLRHHAAALTS